MYLVKAISIQRKNPYTKDPEQMGPLVGEICLTSDQGVRFECALTEDQTRRIMTILADSIAEAAVGMGKLLRQDIIDQIGTPVQKALA